MYYPSPSYYQNESRIPDFCEDVMQKEYRLKCIFIGVLRSVTQNLKQGIAFVCLFFSIIKHLHINVKKENLQQLPGILQICYSWEN